MTFVINKQEDITEEFLMTLLCKVGEARASLMNAITLARKGDFTQSEEMITIADEALADVHRTQTGLIGFDEGEGKVTMTLILTHIQDHIMTTMLCRDLATEIIAIHSLIANKKELPENEKTYI
ncbi:PTS lactose/cellobiose transporter subunit IIA [Photobacterium sp. J15]|uniref:PTS lactose/cellobiose transporter subunit IIA n=1 Tax=Photobacterium sp. J15 TaxID=265901 RepID=UPI0007E330E3|nr:PTS lactose/cellobiose transporter subunit IIA [Photobacterium sp. J15]